MTLIVVCLLGILVGAVLGVTFGTLVGTFIAGNWFADMRFIGFVGWEGGGLLGALCGMLLGALLGGFFSRQIMRWFKNPESTYF